MTRSSDLRTRFWRFITRDQTLDRVVKVKSLRPYWDERSKAVGWPTLLIDRGAQRVTVTPIWDRARYAFWRKPEDRP